MVHDFSPFVWRLNEDIGIHWYGLLILFALGLCSMCMRWLSHRQRMEFSNIQIIDFLLISTVSVLFGARIGFCLFYDPELFLRFRPSAPFWAVLALSEGGLSMHGALIGFVLSTVLFARRRGLNRLYLFDVGGFCAPLVIFFIRIGSFLSGEAFGRPAGESFLLAMKFPREIFIWSKEDPGQLASLALVVQKFGIEPQQWQLWLSQAAGDGAVREKINDVLGHLVLAVDEGDAAIRGALESLLTPRHPAQLYAGALDGILLFVMMLLVWRGPKMAGQVGAFFLIMLSMMHVLLTEYVFLPLSESHYRLNMILNLCAFGLGVIFFLVWSRSGSILIPGWTRVRSIKISRRP